MGSNIPISETEYKNKQKMKNEKTFEKREGIRNIIRKGKTVLTRFEKRSKNQKNIK
jgi:hypothetical protein